jgi:hypothetical protein
MKEEDYDYIKVESFEPKDLGGRHGRLHIRALPGQDPYLPEIFVSCSKVLSEKYPEGTKFRIRAKIVPNPTDNVPYIFSYRDWPYEVLKDEED